jgi:hypothetical protein
MARGPPARWDVGLFARAELGFPKTRFHEAVWPVFRRPDGLWGFLLESGLGLVFLPWAFIGPA